MCVLGAAAARVRVWAGVSGHHHHFAVALSAHSVCQPALCVCSKHLAPALCTRPSFSRLHHYLPAGGLHHLLVHYADTFNKGLCTKRLTSTPDGRVAFVPRGSDVQVLDVHSGQQLALLSQGHYDAVCACAFSPSTGRLWSAGLDGAVLAWEPRPQDGHGDEGGAGGHAMDTWLAAAAAGRGSSRHHQHHAASNAAGAGGTGGRRAGGRAPLPDIDFWSDDEEKLVGQP